jgi:hypothetical protein
LPSGHAPPTTKRRVEARGGSAARMVTQLVLREDDRLAANARQLRASLLLGRINERDYIDALKDDVRISSETYQAALSPDAFVRVHGWKPGVDPFDPRGAISPAEANRAPAASVRAPQVDSPPSSSSSTNSN